MSHFILRIDTDTDAFHPDPEHEVARLLRHVAGRLEVGDDAPILLDVNGNVVGSWHFHGDTEQNADRTERTVWRITVADLDAIAGRELTDDELDRVAEAIDHMDLDIPEAVESAMDDWEERFRRRNPHMHP